MLESAFVDEVSRVARVSTVPYGSARRFVLQSFGRVAAKVPAPSASSARNEKKLVLVVVGAEKLRVLLSQQPNQ